MKNLFVLLSLVFVFQTSVASADHAKGEFYETVLDSCYVFQPFDEKNIYSRDLDKRAPWKYDIASKTVSKVLLAFRESGGQVTVKEFERRVNNKFVSFEANTIEAVADRVKTYLKTNDFFSCPQED